MDDTLGFCACVHIGFVLAMCVCSLLKNKVGKLRQFLVPEACWFSSLWMSRYVFNWASLKNLLSVWVEMLVGISMRHDPMTKV